jgi:RHS repeat-associated protein
MLGRGYVGNGGEGMRYGYNGQERLHELDSHGDTYEFEYRIHDARVGRFLSVDPLYKEYPWNSTYAFAENRVIDGIDLEGREWSQITVGNTTVFTVKIKVVNTSIIDNEQVANTVLPAMQKSISDLFQTNFPDAQFKINIEFDSNISNEPLTKDQIANPDGFYMVLNNVERNGNNIFYPGNTWVGETQNNIFYVALGIDDITDSQGPLATSKSAYTFIFNHELLHTGGLYHPWDPENTADDVDMEKVENKYGTDYLPCSGVDKYDIIHNVMNSVENPSKLLQPIGNDDVLTPDQANVVKNEVITDTNKKQ